MSQTFFRSSVYSIATLFFLLVACSASVENRASSPARTPSRKPPFNGSMFGKRSFLQAPSRINYGSVGVIVPNARDGEEYDVVGNSAVENLALELIRDKPLIQASLDQCIQLQRSLDPEQDPVMATLCSELLDNGKALQQENNVWFKQLLGLDRGFK